MRKSEESKKVIDEDEDNYKDFDEDGNRIDETNSENK